VQVLSSVELQCTLSLTTVPSDAGSNLDDDDDDKSLPDIPEGEEDIEAPPAKRHQKSGQLNPETNGHAPVAMPDNYPEEWKKKFAEGYQQTAETIDQVDTHTRANTDKATSPPERTQERRSKQDTGNALPHADTHVSGGVAAEHHRRAPSAQSMPTGQAMPFSTTALKMGSQTVADELATLSAL